MKKIAFISLCFACILALTKCDSSDSKKTSASDPVISTDSSNVTSHWKIGVQMWTFRMFTFAEALDKVDSSGVNNIEAFWGQPLGAGLKDSFGINMSDESKTKIKELLQAKNIKIVAMGVIVPQTKEEWQKAFDLAKDFGLSYITAEPLKNQWDMIDSMAGAYGIRVAIHDHPKPNAYWSPDSVLAATVGHPNIGSVADLGHWARNGINPVDALKILAGHIFGVHLKDIVKFGDTHAADTVVGKGVIDFDPIFQELKRQNFSGMFSIEHESNWYHNVPDVIEIVKFYHEEVAKLK
ncbi:MAG: sugar phosphate isomerase/epimerase [Ginsengibacter sp.]